MTPLARSLRSTAFRLTFAIFGFGAIGAALVLGMVAFQVIKLVNDETKRTISAEADSLIEQYESGGIRRLALALSTRARTPGGALYLLSDLSAGVTGTVHYVDAGYHAIGMPPAGTNGQNGE